MNEGHPAVAPATIESLGRAATMAMAMLAGIRLDCFTLLAAGPLHLADALGVVRETLPPLLDTLVAAGLLIEAKGRYTNTPETGRFLVRGEPAYLGGMEEVLTARWRSMLRSPAAVRRNGAPAAWGISRLSEEELAAGLLRVMRAPMGMPAAPLDRRFSRRSVARDE